MVLQCMPYNKSYRKYHPNIFFKAEILFFLFVKAFHLNKWLGTSGVPLQPTSSSHAVQGRRKVWKSGGLG